MKTVRVGVLGGIGPESTAEFYSKLIRKLQEKKLVKSNTDFPQIVINSIPGPEIIHDKIAEEELVPFADGLKELDRFGVDFIVMVCNTIHLFYDRLQKQVNTQIIDLRKEIRERLKSEGIKSTFVIGTPNTIRQGLYRFDGIKYMQPDDSEIDQLSKIIENFLIGVDKNKCADEAGKICRKYLKQGADTVILGCTEFAVMLGDADFPKVNTIDVLVDSVIKGIEDRRALYGK